MAVSVSLPRYCPAAALVARRPSFPAFRRLYNDFHRPGSVCTSGGGPGLQNQFKPPIPAAATSIPSTLSATDPADGPGVLASCLALLALESPDLALIVERWKNLPEAVRAGIVAMVKAAEGR